MGQIQPDLTIDYQEWLESSPKGRPTDLDCPLVAGCRISNKSHNSMLEDGTWALVKC